VNGSSRTMRWMLAVLMVAGSLLLVSCGRTTAAPSSAIRTSPRWSDQSEVATKSPEHSIARSQVISDTASPEAVVQAFIDAANLGDGGAMNVLFGPRPFYMFIDDAQGTNSGLAGVVVHAGVPSTGAAEIQGRGFKTGESVSAAASAKLEFVRVRVDATVVKDDYFSLKKGPAILVFDVARSDHDDPWFIVSFGGREH